MLSLYYAIVGTGTDTNQGLGRFLAVIILVILAGGSLFWALGA